MLELDSVDLEMLRGALEDHSPAMQWWLDPKTGESIPKSEDIPWEGLGLTEADEDRLIPIEPTPSHESYSDMEDFIARVGDPRARDLLERAIEGRGAFRRFKDTLLDFEELREAWFAFHDARAERRAIAWLAGEGVIDDVAANRAIEARPDPELTDVPEALDAAGVLADNDFPRQAASRAYYGGFYAAEAALLGTGSEEAAGAIADAERFVDAVREWIGAAR